MLTGASAAGRVELWAVLLRWRAATRTFWTSFDLVQAMANTRVVGIASRAFRMFRLGVLGVLGVLGIALCEHACLGALGELGALG